jgi:hypothetical protein
MMASDAALISFLDAIPAGTAPTFRLLCLWHLWKHRNRVVFVGSLPPLHLSENPVVTPSFGGIFDRLDHLHQ